LILRAIGRYRGVEYGSTSQRRPDIRTAEFEFDVEFEFEGEAPGDGLRIRTPPDYTTRL
jgi:hypothetical protein